MIVRILGEGQFDLDDAEVTRLNELDESLVAAVEAGDEDAFRRDLAAVLDEVRTRGRSVRADYLGPSELVLPHEGATIEEVRALLSDEGLIPNA